MRIVSWNIHRRIEEPWDYLFNHLDADVALLQECTRLPDSVDDSKVIHRLATNRKFGNAIYVKNSEITEYTLESAQEGSLVISVVETPKEQQPVHS